MVVPEIGAPGIFYFKRTDAWDRPLVSLGWRITDRSDEPWTARFNAFKAGDERAVRAATTVGVELLANFAAWFGGNVSVVCACGHFDPHPLPNSPVSRLALAVATRFGWTFEPNLLRHRLHSRLSGVRDAGARRKLIDGAYTAARATHDRILIVDDFTTRGETMAEITRALVASRSTAKPWGFALGKTERQAWASMSGRQLNNDHLTAATATAWDTA